MTQPSPRVPLTPMQPMAPRRPSAPMQPLARLVPMQPLAPLRPGERRQPAAAPQYEPTYEPVVDYPPPPPTVYQAPVYQAPVYQPPPPQVVNLGLSQLPMPRTPQGWTGAPMPQPPRMQVPFPVRRPSGNKAGVVIGIVVALIVGLAAIGSRSSSGNSPSFAVPSFAIPSFSIPPLSVGGSSSGQHHAPQPSTPHAPRRTNSVNLTGTISGESIRVTPLRWVNSAHSKSSFFGPGAGKRWFAVQFRVTDIGSIQYVDSPANGARVIDTKGHRYRSTIAVNGIREGKVFAAAVSVPTGKSLVGYIVFEVPKRAKIKQVQFAENSGFGQKGVWIIKG